MLATPRRNSRAERWLAKLIIREQAYRHSLTRLRDIFGQRIRVHVGINDQNVSGSSGNYFADSSKGVVRISNANERTLHIRRDM
jgi:hypothetical protein